MTSIQWPAPLAAPRPFITDGGLETTLIFHDGIELPHFAAYALLADHEGLGRLQTYYEGYAQLAGEHDVGLILDTPTWRASSDWGARLGHSADGLDELNRRAVALVAEVRARHEGSGLPIAIEGAVGPRGDGYTADEQMTPDDAAAYHEPQLRSFAEGGADLATAWTITYAEEAIGLVRAADAVGLPIAISFTLETDGRLPSGQALAAAIEQVDAATGAGAVCFLVNCAHPEHIAPALTQGGGWRERVGGLRANASRRSHAELDEAPDLDAGDPHDLAQGYLHLRDELPNAKLIGGCCGTDQRHIAEICRAWQAGPACSAE